MSSNTERENADEIERSLKVTIPLACDAVVPLTAKLLQKHKDLKEIDDALQVRREEFNTQMRKGAKRRILLQEKEKSLIESLKKFEEFVKDSDTKRKRARSKYVHEKELVFEKNQELEALVKERKFLVHKKETLEGYLEKYSPVKKYMESVVEASVQYEEIVDVMAFYETLVSVNQDLVMKEQLQLRAIDNEREKLNNYKTEKTNRLLALRNQLYELQWKREKARHRIVELEAQFHDLKSSQIKKALSLRQIIMGISSMHAALCDFEKVSSAEEDTLKQMDKVHEFIQDWSEVVQIVKEMEESENSD